MICKAILKNDVKASYTNTIIPAGSEIEVAHTPPVALVKSINTKYDTFIYAILVYKNKTENLHISREDVVDGDKISDE